MGGQKGYVIVAYRVETGKNDKRTLFAQENTIGMENQKEVKLLEGFEDIHFEYFFKEATAEAGPMGRGMDRYMNFPRKDKNPSCLGEPADFPCGACEGKTPDSTIGCPLFLMNYPRGILVLMMRRHVKDNKKDHKGRKRRRAPHGFMGYYPADGPCHVFFIAHENGSEFDVFFRDGVQKKFFAEAALERAIMEIYHRQTYRNQTVVIEGNEVVRIDGRPYDGSIGTGRYVLQAL